MATATVYVCPQCGYEAASPGKCPNCDVPLDAEKDNVLEP